MHARLVSRLRGISDEQLQGRGQDSTPDLRDGMGSSLDVSQQGDRSEIQGLPDVIPAICAIVSNGARKPVLTCSRMV